MSVPIQQRVTGILTTPLTEWPTIAAEVDTVPDLYKRYIVPLAAVGPLAAFLRYPAMGSLVAAVITYALQLAAVIISAKIIEWLAPKFGSTGDTMQTTKLVAYASTPSWLAGIGNLIPWLGPVLALLGGLYAIYLFYVGLPPVMKTPAGQVVPFMIVSAIVVLVVMTVLGAFAGLFGATSLALL